MRTPKERLSKRVQMAAQRDMAGFPAIPNAGGEATGSSGAPPLLPMTAALVPMSLEERLELEAEGGALVRNILLNLDEEKRDTLLEMCERECLQAVIRPFGVARLLFVDQEGGPVDTIHNVSTQSRDRQGRPRFYDPETDRECVKNKSGKLIYLDGTDVPDEKKRKPNLIRPILVFATETERDKHETAMNDATEVSRTVRTKEKYENKRKRLNKEKESGNLRDPLSKNGGTFSKEEKIDLDHTVPCIEIARDARVSLADIPVDKLANMDINLMPMREWANRSKNGYQIKDVVEKWERNIQAIKKLEEMAKEKPLNQKQKDAIAKLKQLQAIDLGKLVEADEAVRNKIAMIVSREYYFSGKFRERVMHSGIASGANMGLQQAVGVLMEEFVRASFAEVKDAWRNGFKQNVDQSFWNAVRARLERIAHRVAAKWQDAVQAFGDGAVSGFISNILTIAINCFLTTAAKWVRIIREGAMSLYRALKLLAFPPEGMTLEQAAHEASKLLVAGAVVGLGVLMEEAISKVLAGASSGILVPITDYAVSVMVGLVTGLATACATYMLDRLDLFGVNADKRHDLVMAKLNQIIDESYAQGIEAAEVFDGPPLLHLPSPS